MMSSKHLKLHRYLQEKHECAIASSSSVANFYNKKVNYDYARSLVKNHDGLWTPQIGILLNELGFEKVTIITADIRQLDFDWKGLTKRQLINRLNKNRRSFPDQNTRSAAKEYLRFLCNKSCDNSVIIDLKFGKYIREFLDAGKPVMASFNWNLFFNSPKTNSQGINDPVRGDYEEHEVVIYGYDENGVSVLDSHHECYHGRLAKYRTGRYIIDWETLHTIIGFGDLILPDNYNPKIVKLGRYELV